jgi:hypothetical protein
LGEDDDLANAGRQIGDRQDRSRLGQLCHDGCLLFSYQKLPQVERDSIRSILYNTFRRML